MMPLNQLSALLTLSSANLPVGAYCYSQGVETAIEQGLIHDEKSGLAFLEDYLELYLLAFEIPYLKQLFESELAATARAQYFASFDTLESRNENRQMAHALRAWAKQVLELDIEDEPHSYLSVFVAICQNLALNPKSCALSYAFSLLENLTLAIVKTLPLGQMAGQRILWNLHKNLEQRIEAQWCLNIKPSGNLPGLARLQCMHETQYSRLFRS